MAPTRPRGWSQPGPYSTRQYKMTLPRKVTPVFLVVIAKVGTALDRILSWSSLLFEPSRNRILHEGSNGLPGQDRSRTTRSRRGERTHKAWARSGCANLRVRTVRTFAITTSGVPSAATNSGDFLYRHADFDLKPGQFCTSVFLIRGP